MEPASTVFTLRRSSRARHVRIGITPDGAVTVTLPYRIPIEFAERFVAQKKKWIASKLASFAKHHAVPLPQHTKNEYRKIKEEARSVITETVDRYSGEYGFCYNSIAIRNQSTRWGSCSKQGNLNFSYRLLFVPITIREYVVVHELCHLKEMNHGQKFWQLVERILPDYRDRRQALRRFRLR